MLILGLRADGAHGVTEVAGAVAPRIPTARTEAEEARVGVADADRAERGQPVVAVRTGTVEATIPAIARSWEEKLTSVISSQKDTINSILLSKSSGAIMHEFLLLSKAWHSPRTAHSNMSNIV